MRKVELPYLREISHYAQGLLQDGRIVGYTYIRWTFNLYPKHCFYRPWIRFEKEAGTLRGYCEDRTAS